MCCPKIGSLPQNVMLAVIFPLKIAIESGIPRFEQTQIDISESPQEHSCHHHIPSLPRRQEDGTGNEKRMPGKLHYLWTYGVAGQPVANVSRLEAAKIIWPGLTVSIYIYVYIYMYIYICIYICI